MAAASDEQVDRAVGTARRAQPSWQATDVVTRSRLVADLATRIRAEADELARLESHDTGKPLSQARVDVEQCAEYFDFAAAGVRMLAGEVIPTGSETLAHTRGATLVTGGGRPSRAGDDGLAEGFCWAPTLFTGVHPEADLFREEVFGPVLATTPFDDLDDALRLANATDYGLTAAIWTADVDRAHWLAHRVEAGQVYVNQYGAGGGVAFPFGGVKQSGHGREKGMAGLLAATRVKTVAVRTRPGR